MRLNKNTFSKVSLLSVLKRKKISFQKYLDENGIVTYGLLVSRCNSMGMVPPTENEFLELTGRKHDETPKVSSPAEGVVILEPPQIISEKTGKPIEDFPAESFPEAVHDQITDAVTQVVEHSVIETTAEEESQETQRPKKKKLSKI
jgi:hypothetical protein